MRSLTIPIVLRASQAGLTLTGRLFDAVGAQVGSDISTGFEEIGGGLYEWRGEVADDFSGSFRVFGGTDPLAVAGIDAPASGGGSAPTAAEIADAVWDEAMEDHLEGESLGGYVYGISAVASDAANAAQTAATQATASYSAASAAATAATAASAAASAAQTASEVAQSASEAAQSAVEAQSADIATVLALVGRNVRIGSVETNDQGQVTYAVIRVYNSASAAESQDEAGLVASYTSITDYDADGHLTSELTMEGEHPIPIAPG